ncbi:hypothetical protein [Shimia sp.]|uniref:DUF1653 domain-containing protein n=1 Tax=Shimia sp. TaxID=1954381 RepID=UPI0032975967
MLFRHKKRGSVYRLINIAVQESDMSAVAVYSDTESGLLWTRPAEEFFDGRFEVVLSRETGGNPAAREWMQ